MTNIGSRSNTVLNTTPNSTLANVAYFLSTMIYYISNTDPYIQKY